MDLDEEALDGFVGNAADERAEREGDEAEDERDAPVASVQARHLERVRRDEDDEDLRCDFWGGANKSAFIFLRSSSRLLTDERNDHEIIIPQYPLEHIQLVVDPCAS